MQSKLILAFSEPIDFLHRTLSGVINRVVTGGIQKHVRVGRGIYIARTVRSNDGYDGMSTLGSDDRISHLGYSTQSEGLGSFERHKPNNAGCQLRVILRHVEDLRNTLSQRYYKYICSLISDYSHHVHSYSLVLQRG